MLVAANRNELEANQGNLWDSGQVRSDQSIQVRYAGKALVSEQECFWKVRVWDEHGKPSAWSEPAHWTMGLLKPSDWHAKWIGVDEPAVNMAAKQVLGNAQWIWFPEGQPEKAAPVGTRYFRRSDQLACGSHREAGDAVLHRRRQRRILCQWPEGGDGGNFHSATETDVTKLLQPGKNILAVSVKNGGAEPNPAGLIALLHVEFAQGAPLVVVTDSSWKSGKQAVAGWKDAGFEDAGWVAAQKLGPAGMAPWGEISGPEDRRVVARMLRREFGRTEGPPRDGLRLRPGLVRVLSEWRKVGDQVLSPGLTDYSKRLFYVTFDVTKGA